jgi:hypothetical protein
MGLSRLENFLRSVRGNIIYVDPNALDSTDSIENDGTSAARPFKTLQRALIEAARFSYLPGPNNDKFGNTTILLYPGEHIIDNRPGWIPITGSTFLKRDGTTSSDFYEFDLQTNFDINADNNILYKFNSVHGGVMVPRGTSIVGYDLRKTKIRPKYVPNPENNNIERSAIFRLTGACYLWQMSIFDANPNGVCYKDYTNNTFVPNFSHNKLTIFEYADGSNPVEIKDAFNNYSTDRTDLDIYYQKIGLAYGNSSGRKISPDYPNIVDIQSKIDEHRIVGSRGEEVGISSIRAGDGLGGGERTEITVTLAQEVTGLDVDTPIRINSVGISTFNGQYVVNEVISDTEIKYITSNPPPVGVDNIIGQGTLNIVVDTVTSASPYIFNCSVRSVYGLCGLHADGNSVTGFKSMVVAQFTGISLQKDDNAFVKYDPTSGSYVDTTNVPNIYSDSLARYKPSYESYHIKASNNAFIQCVSIFAIGYSNHFEADSGGDMSITNSNSNFGARSLVSKGFRDDKFIRDDLGYISHIIPPKEIESNDITIEFNAIDVTKTVSVGNSSRLYLYNETNENQRPINVIDGYRIGAKQNDQLNVILTNSGISTTYSATIRMDGSTGTNYQKEYDVAKLANGITNNIAANTITLTNPHNILNGETVRIISETGEIPDGLDNNSVYFAITNATATGIGSTQIRLAASLNDAENGNVAAYAIDILTAKTANLKVVSRVSDKSSGDIGHPIQYDLTNNQWYLSVNANNQIYNALSSSGISVSPRTYISRSVDNRNLDDTVYKFRYVIPRDTSIKARPPLDGFIIQDSTSLPASDTEIGYQYSPDNTTKTLTDSTQLKNTRFISNASWVGSVATIETEIPHHLSVGSQVEVLNVLSSNNPSGLSTTGYNGSYTVTDVLSRKQFSYTLTNDPGTFLDNTSVRNSSLPYFNRKKLPGTYIVYRSEQVQEYIQNQQDGIYYISVINSSNNPTVAPFNNLRLSQPVQYLYPQLDRDNVISDPDASQSFALSDPIGQVIVNDPQKSITKETLENFLLENKVGFGLTNILSNSAGTAHTFYSKLDHGLNPITDLTITTAGSAYGTTGAIETLYNASLTGGSGEGASAVIKINPSGEITDVEVIDGGSAYQVGDVLTVVGVATTTGHTPGTVTVSSIYNHTGEVIQLTGITNQSYKQYNDLYRITGISTGRQIQVASAGTISTPSTTGIGVTLTATSNAYLTGKSLTASSFLYNNLTGIATVTFASSHGLLVSNKVKVSGANNSLYNGNFLVSKVNSLTSINLNVGVSTSSPATTGTIIIHPYGYSSRGGNNAGRDEGRIVKQYIGVAATISAGITTTTTTISISNVDSTGLKIGDYLEIDSEIMRIRETVDGNPVSVFRGLLGTRSSSHLSGSVIRKIYPYPVEFRRHSILRASGHTFEYVGFGPGNYSNAFPDRQDRQISEQEELLSQSFKVDGGINVYTGMNNDGDFYIGNKRVSSATGQEDVFDAPVPSIRGEEIFVETGTAAAINIVNTEDLNVTRSIKIEGGKDGNNISEFNGPVVFNDKITSNSSRGIEANSIYLQGNATISRKHTVGISTPIIQATAGDVEYYSQPDDGGYIGWVYTTNNEWRKYGPIQNQDGQYVGIWTGTFYGDGSNLTNLDSIWIEVNPFIGNSGINTAYYLNNVGIGTSIVASDVKLKIQGKTYIDGLLNVTEIIEKATIVTIAWPPLDGGGNAVDIPIYLGDNNVYYYTNTPSKNWTLNFTGHSDGTTLNDILEVGDSITVAFLATNGSVGYYNSAVRIDGTLIAPRWYGGFAPTFGNSNSIDSYTYVIIKTANSTFTVLASQSTYA